MPIHVVYAKLPESQKVIVDIMAKGVIDEVKALSKDHPEVYHPEYTDHAERMVEALAVYLTACMNNRPIG